MNAREFARYLKRDGGCLHCGETEAVAPHHRANRGMGGSKERDVQSNIIVLCSRMNGLVESNAHYARTAQDYGWKVSTHANPADVPVYDANTGTWYVLKDNYKREKREE